MTLKKNISQTGEIDLVEIYFIILKNKTKIFLTIFISLILMAGYLYVQKPVKLKYEAMTDIIPISKFEEFEYEEYNDYLSNTSSMVLQYPVQMKSETFFLNKITMDFNEVSFKKIEHQYLVELFLQKIYDQTFLYKAIVDSEIINKEDYENDTKYINAITEFLNNIKLIPGQAMNKGNQLGAYNSENVLKISFIIDDKNKTKKFLNNLQQMINLEIKNYLIENFNSKIKTQKDIKRYNIEDIHLELSNTKDESYARRLEIEKLKLEKQKDIERVVNAFNSTPIVNSTQFTAARILSNKVYYKTLGKQLPSNTSMLIMAIVFGLVFGILYVLLSTAIQKRVRHKNKLTKF